MHSLPAWMYEEWNLLFVSGSALAQDLACFCLVALTIAYILIKGAHKKTWSGGLIIKVHLTDCDTLFKLGNFCLIPICRILSQFFIHFSYQPGVPEKPSLIKTLEPSYNTFRMRVYKKINFFDRRQEIFQHLCFKGKQEGSAPREYLCIKEY